MKKPAPRKGSFALPLALALLSATGLAQQTTWTQQTLDWVEQHARPDGTYGPIGVPWSTPEATDTALRIRDLLGAPLAAEHAARLREGLLRMNAEASRAAAGLCLLDLAQRTGAKPPPLLRPLEAPWIHPFSWVGSDSLTEFADRVLLHRRRGLPLPEEAVLAWLRYFQTDEQAYGYPYGFSEVSDRAARADFSVRTPPARAEARVANLRFTHAAMRVQGYPRSPKEREQLRHWLQRWRKPAGAQQAGYAHSALAGAAPTLADTSIALELADGIGTLTEDPEVLAFVLCHQHEQHGFASERGGRPSLVATRDALVALQRLGHDPKTLSRPAPSVPTPARAAPELPLRQALIQMGPDIGTSLILAARADVDLIVLKGIENPRAAMERAQSLKERLGLTKPEVAFSREDHTRVGYIEGLGYATHLSEWIFGSEQDLELFGNQSGATEFFAASEKARAKGALSFATLFRNEEVATPFLRHRPGFDGLTLAWSLAPAGDLVRAHPWLSEWTQDHAAIGNSDAHGDPFHWWHRSLFARTLYFAEDASFVGFAEAIRDRRTVAMTALPDPVFYGRSPWTERARAARELWQRGAKGVPSEPWLPAPIALPVDAVLPGPAQELRLAIRAANRLGDDALPFEVRCTIDGHRADLRLAPFHASAPALVAALPAGVDPMAESHEVVIEAFGQTTHQSIDLRPPPLSEGRRNAVAHAGPRAIDLSNAEHHHFVKTALHPSDFQGRLGLAIARTDILLGRRREKNLRLGLAGGNPGETIAVYWDGQPLGRIAIDGQPAEHRFELMPESAGEEAMAHTLSLRTERPGWLPSFPRPETSLALTAVELLD